MSVAGVNRGRSWLKSLASESNLRGYRNQPGSGFSRGAQGYPEIMLGHARLRLNGVGGNFDQSMDNGVTYGRAFRAYQVNGGSSYNADEWWSDIDYRCYSDSAATLTLRPDSAANIVIGCRAQLHQTGPGRLTVVAGAGVSITRLAGKSLSLAGQHGVAWVEKTGPNVWRMWGDLAPA